MVRNDDAAILKLGCGTNVQYRVASGVGRLSVARQAYPFALVVRDRLAPGGGTGTTSGVPGLLTGAGAMIGYPGALTDVEVTVFEPSADPARGVRKTPRPTMTPGRAALLGLMDRYLAGLLDPFISPLEVHKLMYFMQEAGEPLRLRLAKGPYGPYAENLRHVLRARVTR